MIKDMKKNYNIPATEVVVFAGSAIMQAASPAAQNPNPNNNDPSVSGGGPIGD
jgi:hypothetical protein